MQKRKQQEEEERKQQEQERHASVTMQNNPQVRHLDVQVVNSSSSTSAVSEAQDTSIT